MARTCEDGCNGCEECTDYEKSDPNDEAEILRQCTSWLRACLSCKDWAWDGDQREMAEQACQAAETIFQRKREREQKRA